MAAQKLKKETETVSEEGGGGAEQVIVGGLNATTKLFSTNLSWLRTFSYEHGRYKEIFLVRKKTTVRMNGETRLR